MSDELQVVHPFQSVAVAPLIDKIVTTGITKDNVDALRELLALQNQQEARFAEKAFNRAFAGLQAELCSFKTTADVPGKDGKTRYSFLTYDAIMAVVKPLMQKHGLTVAYSADFLDGRIVTTCTFSHLEGHSKDFKSFARPGAGPYGATETQADGAAMTYGKRYALCLALNITVDRDTDSLPDAKEEGSAITFEQAETLKELVKETGSDEAKFLEFAGARTYDAIGTKRYQQLFAELQKKRNRR